MVKDIFLNTIVKVVIRKTQSFTGLFPFSKATFLFRSPKC